MAIRPTEEEITNKTNAHDSHSDKCIRIEGKRKNGSKNGVWTEWYECSVSDTENARRHQSSRLSRLLNDEPEPKELKKHKVRAQRLKRFDGGVRLVTNYRDGIKEGKRTLYDIDNNKLLECNFKNNKLDGSLVKWDKIGNKTLECNYKNGLKDGMETIWNTMSRLSSIRKYLNDYS